MIDAAPAGPDIFVYRPYIEAALPYGGNTHTFDDIVAGVASGRFMFWPGAASAIVTEIHEYPRGKTLHFFLAGGNLAELEAMTPGVLEWGRAMGCTAATLTGRRGWERTFLTRTGWSHELVVLRKPL